MRFVSLLTVGVMGRLLTSGVRYRRVKSWAGNLYNGMFSVPLAVWFSFPPWLDLVIKLSLRWLLFLDLVLWVLIIMNRKFNGGIDLDLTGVISRGSILSCLCGLCLGSFVAGYFLWFDLRQEQRTYNNGSRLPSSQVLWLEKLSYWSPVRTIRTQWGAEPLVYVEDVDPPVLDRHTL